ncbi:MAG TPA: hypothetical protein DIT15_16065 [Arthrobacter bacterium]|nr:hypothetical protein [Arthrobacter sp.]
MFRIDDLKNGPAHYAKSPLGSGLLEVGGRTFLECLRATARTNWPGDGYWGQKAIAIRPLAQWRPLPTTSCVLWPRYRVRLAWLVRCRPKLPQLAQLLEVDVDPSIPATAPSLQ